ncbi:RluA family pseudouridine synthase [candidate division KSB1 bacterium]|nr:RluA family pseudouridine synthase [candidate division KSB1 bacterium]
MTESINEIIVPAHKSKERLDAFLAHSIERTSRSQIQKWIKEGLILVDGQPAKPKQSVLPNQTIQITRTKLPPIEAQPESIPLDIVFEDESLLIINKHAGMVVHPAYGNRTGTLVNALLGYSKDLSEYHDDLDRPGIVHRIDKDTSGLLVVAKDEEVHRDLALQFKDKSVHREYVAVVWGKIQKGQGTVDAPLARSIRDRRKISVSEIGKRAVTHYQVLQRFPIVTLLQLRLETGRTHQIRVHLAHKGHPVFGDQTYGGRTRQLGGLNRAQTAEVQDWLGLMPRQALHAKTLGFVHPKTGKTIHFDSELPVDMQILIERIQNYQNTINSEQEKVI